MKAQTLIATAVGALALSAAFAWVPAPAARAADGKVDFVKDVQPILAAHCVKCHGADPDGKKPKGKYDMTTKEGALKGGENKNDLVPGKAADSLAYKLLLGPVGSGDDEIERMPKKKDPLTQAQIDTIKNWIDQGANWPDGVKIKLAK